MNLWKRTETIPKTIRKRVVGGSNPSAGTSTTSRFVPQREKVTIRRLR
jgi:hypothetical protein